HVPPPVEAPRASLAPSELRRSSIRTLGPNVSPTDGAVLRTQADASAIPAPSAGLTNAMGLAGSARPAAVTLSATTDPDGNPVILLGNAPPNSTIRLLRDNQVVNEVVSGSATSSTLAITDNLRGPVPSGTPTYAVELVGADNKGTPLGRVALQVAAAEA